MINIGIIESQTLLQESFKLILETQPSNKVLVHSNHYDDLRQVKESLDIVFLDIPNFQQCRNDMQHIILSKGTKIIVLAQRGEERFVTEAMDAKVQGFLFKEMEAEELLDALQQILKGKIYIHGQATHHLVTFFRKQIENKEQKGLIEQPTEEHLPKRMFQTLELAAQGLSNEEIASKMRVSDKTVKNQMSHILSILHVSNRTAAVVKAVQNGWVVIPKL